MATIQQRPAHRTISCQARRVAPVTGPAAPRIAFPFTVRRRLRNRIRCRFFATGFVRSFISIAPGGAFTATGGAVS
jgi:hypothetical protein